MNRAKPTDAEVIAAFVAAARDAGALIEHIQHPDCLSELRTQLPQPYPAIFGSFLSAYFFAPFDFSGIILFGNSGEDVHYNLCRAVIVDQATFEGTAPCGALQFGRPDDGSYDPICFDLNRDDAPIVRFDREANLCNYSISNCQQTAPSFREFASAI